MYLTFFRITDRADAKKIISGKIDFKNNKADEWQIFTMFSV